MAPLMVGGSDEQLQKYLGRLVEEPLMAVRNPSLEGPIIIIIAGNDNVLSEGLG